LVAITKRRERVAGDRAALERQLAIGGAETWSVDDWNSHITLLSLAWGFHLMELGAPPRRRPAAAARQVEHVPG
jgi:hypothetical protein